MNDIRKDSMEVIREIIRTGKWKVGEPKKRRQSLFSRKIAVDDLSYRSYRTEEGTFRSNREATINDPSNLDLDPSIHKEESGMTTVTAGDMKLEDIQ